MDGLSPIERKRLKARAAALEEICARLEAQPVQHIGKVLVIFRQKPATRA